MNRLSNNIKVIGSGSLNKTVKIELDGAITFCGTLRQEVGKNGKIYAHIDHNNNGCGSTICLDNAYVTKCEIIEKLVSRKIYSPIIFDKFNDVSPIVFDLFKEIGGISRFNTDCISLGGTKYISLNKLLKTRLQMSVYDIKRIVESGYNMIYMQDKVRILPSVLNYALEKSLRLSKGCSTHSKNELMKYSDDKLGNIISDGTIVISYRYYTLYLLLDRIMKRQNGANSIK